MSRASGRRGYEDEGGYGTMAEPSYRDSHFQLGGGSGIELPPGEDRYARRGTPQQNTRLSGGPAVGTHYNGGDSYAATFSPAAAAPRPPPLRDWTEDAGYSERRTGLSSPPPRGTVADDPQRAYNHYAQASGTTTAQIFDPRDDRARMQTMQRFQASSVAHQTRFNPVLQQYANDDEERAARQREREIREKKLGKAMSYRQPELGSIRDLHEGEAPPPPRRRGATGMTITKGSDIFNPKPLPQKSGRKHTSSPYAHESEDWWVLNRVPEQPARDERINPYLREAHDINAKNRGTNLVDILSPDRHASVGERLTRAQEVERARVPSNPAVARRAAENGFGAKGSIISHDFAVEKVAEPVEVATIATLGTTGGRDPGPEFRPSKRTFGSSPLRVRGDYDIVNGRTLNGEDQVFRPSRRPVDSGMQTGAGVATSLYYRSADARSPGADEPAGSVTGGKGKKNFSEKHWGESGGDLWKPDVGSFTFNRY